MQRQTVLVVAAVIAAVATALWLWPLRPAAPRPVAAAVVAPPPAPAMPAAPAASAPDVAAAPPAPPAEDAKPAPPLAVPPPPPAAPQKREIAAPAPTDAAPASAEGDANAADGSDEAADAGESPPAIDEDHAIDLFAERMTALEQGGDDEADRNDASLQKVFDGRGDGGEDAAARARELRGHLQAWIAALPPDHPHDVLLASVDCREGGCRVLVAEGGVDLSGQAETPGSAAVNSLQESFLALRPAPWWRQLQLGETSMSMHAADPASAPGYVLWTIYIDVTADGDGAAANAPEG